MIQYISACRNSTGYTALLLSSSWVRVRQWADSLRFHTNHNLDWWWWWRAMKNNKRKWRRWKWILWIWRKVMWTTSARTTNEKEREREIEAQRWPQRLVRGELAYFFNEHKFPFYLPFSIRRFNMVFIEVLRVLPHPSIKSCVRCTANRHRFDLYDNKDTNRIWSITLH